MTDTVLDAIDNALHDYQTSPDAMRWTPEPAKRPEIVLTPNQIEGLRRTFASVGAAVANGIKSFVAGFERAMKSYVKVAHRLMEHDRRRCPTCRPYANPKPLAFGAEYRRRSRTRNRR